MKIFAMLRRRLTGCLLLLALGCGTLPVVAAEASTTGGGTDVPYLNDVVCTSEFEATDYHVELSPGLFFHWRHENSVFNGVLHLQNKEAWLGIGFSKEDGLMEGSRVLVGNPALPEAASVKLFHVNNRTLDGLQNLGQNIHFSGKLIRNVKGTFLHFHTKQYHKLAFGGKTNQFHNLIWAVGKDTTVGMHQQKGSFKLFTQGCPVPAALPSSSSSSGSGASGTKSASSSSSPPPSSSYYHDHKAAFAAHGFFAILTFAVVIPLAVTSALFREVIPKQWIYVHVISNTLGAFFATISVACGVGGVIVRGYDAASMDATISSHMTNSHHWVGMVLFLVVIFQVFSGFRRPPVEVRSDPTQQLYGIDVPDAKDTCCFCLPSLETARDKWRAMHITTALIVIGMAFFQLQSGLKLFTTEYGGNTKAALTVLWVWVSFLVVFLSFYKCILKSRKQKLRSSTKNIMPHSMEQEDETEGLDFSSSTSPGINEFSNFTNTNMSTIL